MADYLQIKKQNNERSLDDMRTVNCLNMTLIELSKRDKFLRLIEEIKTRDLVEDYKEGDRIYDLNLADIGKLALRIYTKAAEAAGARGPRQITPPPEKTAPESGHPIPLVAEPGATAWPHRRFRQLHSPTSR